MSLAYFCMACNISRVHKRQENTSSLYLQYMYALALLLYFIIMALAKTLASPTLSVKLSHDYLVKYCT
jgi:hypothetical protein